MQNYEMPGTMIMSQDLSTSPNKPILWLRQTNYQNCWPKRIKQSHKSLGSIATNARLGATIPPSAPSTNVQCVDVGEQVIGAGIARKERCGGKSRSKGMRRRRYVKTVSHILNTLRICGEETQNVWPPEQSKFAVIANRTPTTLRPTALGK